MNKHIVIYTEAGFSLGLGNVFRSLSLSNKIREESGIEISFITSSESYVRDIITKHHFSVIYKESQKEILDYIIDREPDLLIIDYLNINENFTKRIKNDTQSRIVIIGNISEANNHADLVINAIIGTDFKNNIRKDHNNTLYLEGPKYLVLREEFTRNEGKYQYNGQLKNITLLFGGTDQANLSCKILNELAEYDYNITVILGAGYMFDEELLYIIKKKKIEKKIQILRNINNISEVLLLSDFVITSPGTSLFEAFSLGVPALAFFQNQSQQEVFRSFYRTKKHEDILDLNEYIDKLYYNEFDLYKENLYELSVGKGKTEIINNILKLLEA